MRRRLVLVLAVLSAGCKPDPEPEPPAPRPAASAEEVTAASPRADAAGAREIPRYAAPTPPGDLHGPILDTVGVGRVVYPVPSAADFTEHADIVTIARNSVSGGDFSDAQPCALELLRGWLRVTCATYLPSVSLLGGSNDGLYLAADEGTATIIMALVPGDRRVLQIARGGGSYGSSELTGGAVLSETWVGTTAPHVVISPPGFVQTF